ncbi:DNA helicase, partial [Tanacetum coccineum]
MRGKSKKLLNSDKPKLLENPNSILNFKEHDVTSHSWPGSSVYGHRSESEGLFQTLPLSRAIEQQVTYESSGEVTPTILHCYLPLEGISMQVSRTTSCDLKRKSQPDDALDVFDRYSQLCTRNVLPRRSSSSPHLPTSFSAVGTNNDKSAHIISNDSLNTTFVQNETVRLGSNERDLERVFLKPQHVRDDLYGCLFQQSESVETQGSVHVSFLASRPSKRTHSDVFQGTLPSEGSPLKRSHSSTSRVTNRRMTIFRRANAGHDTSGHIGGVSYVYNDLGDCDQRCYHYGATFWFGERLKGHSNSRKPAYHLCCGGGRIYMDPTPDPPEYIKSLLQNKHFMDNIRAYNQMFAMTSFGAKIDESINNGIGPYVFKVSGQVYHWIGSLCPLAGEPPRFLQLYIYDMQHELENRMTTRDRCQQIDVPEFKIRLYNGDGSTEFDVVIQHRGGPPQRISKLHQSYMSLQFPLLFVYGQSGFHTKLKLKPDDGRDKERRLTMLAYYAYQLHPRKQSDMRSDYLSGLYDVISRGERDGYKVGGRIILPMSFTEGSRRYMADYLELTAADRPDIVCRVFEQKIHAFLDFLKREKIFGAVTRDSESKIQGPEDFDRLISAELLDPQTDPQGYKVVSEMMIHGPCGDLNMNATCMKCNKEPVVKILSVHLEGMQRITFRDKDKLEYVVNLPGQKNMTLIEWLAYNEANEDGRHLTFVFAHILTHCEVIDPLKLWTKYWKEMSHDIPERVSEMTYIPNYHLNDDRLQGYILYELEIILTNYGKSLQHFGLGPPPPGLLDMLANRLLMEERNYKQEELQQEKNESIPKGTGKTFLWKTIISTLRCEGKIVLAVASSGIASLILPSGRTAHSIFKLPIELTEESLCKVTKNSQLGKLLADTDLIIWDKAPMKDKRCFEALDRSLRDILTMPHRLFGGKSILLGGDFRQTLPVKKGASKMEIIASCISQSELWSYFKVFTLNENMRLSRPGVSAEKRNLICSFASWLLDIGDGRTGLSKLINFVYDEMTLRTPSVITLQEKAIVCPKNETADMINSKVLEMVQGETTTYLSHDEAIPLERDGADTEMLYPVEHLNTLKFPGFPPHRLELKIGAPVTLVRNVNVAGGLCNGTRMI